MLIDRTLRNDCSWTMAENPHAKNHRQDEYISMMGI